MTISTGYVSPSQRSNCRQSTARDRRILQSQLTLNRINCKETRTANNSAEMITTKFSRNDRSLKNKVATNKYYNNNASCQQSNLGATGIISNLQYASGTLLMYYTFNMQIIIIIIIIIIICIWYNSHVLTL